MLNLFIFVKKKISQIEICRNLCRLKLSLNTYSSLVTNLKNNKYEVFGFSFLDFESF